MSPGRTTPLTPPLTPDEKLTTAQTILGHTFTHTDLLVEALQAAGNGYAVQLSTRTYTPQKNTRLALLGDGLLSSILREAWYATSQPLASWSRVAETVLANRHPKGLGCRGVKMGLGDCLFLNPGMWTYEVGMVATAVEALVGAVFLDVGGGGKGWEAVKVVVGQLGLLEHELLK
ncbi:hypothetical protein M011DRAFT_461422 [Sporormia fimetaria CBS 119925]|uniref:RNase III domain-containing protein n=1 Tax=Sporormia fimetaria CBS 119925 TaxID=1340428 RepID=A0A6A6V235_9PLEO|nr:hypothetical protein M011DRAFT_461422 [Sporormia fimetaria CBS 119925]